MHLASRHLLGLEGVSAADITVLAPDGSPATIKRHEPDEAVEIVGVHQAIDGNMDAQYAALQSKVQEWETLMWSYQKALPTAAPGEKWVRMEKIFSL